MKRNLIVVMIMTVATAVVVAVTGHCVGYEPPLLFVGLGAATFAFMAADGLLPNTQK